jgi:hypothetical protein
MIYEDFNLLMQNVVTSVDFSLFVIIGNNGYTTEGNLFIFKRKPDELNNGYISEGCFWY